MMNQMGQMEIVGESEEGYTELPGISLANLL